MREVRESVSQLIFQYIFGQLQILGRRGKNAIQQYHLPRIFFEFLKAYVWKLKKESSKKNGKIFNAWLALLWLSAYMNMVLYPTIRLFVWIWYRVVRSFFHADLPNNKKATFWTSMNMTSGKYIIVYHIYIGRWAGALPFH